MKIRSMTIVIVALLTLSYGCGQKRIDLSSAPLLDKIPVHTGVEAEAVLMKCVKSIDEKGYALYDDCTGDFHSYYEPKATKTAASSYEKGLFKIDARLGYEELSVGGNAYYNSEYIINEQYSQNRKKDISFDDLSTLYDQCRDASSQQIIVSAYHGCSATEKIVDVKQFDAKLVQKFISAGALRKGVVTIGDPQFQIAKDSDKIVSCGSPKIISVKTSSLADICRNIITQRMTAFENLYSKQSISVVNLNNRITELEALKIQYQQKENILRTKIEDLKNNIQALNVKMSEQNDASKELLDQLNATKNEAKRELDEANAAHNLSTKNLTETLTRRVEEANVKLADLMNQKTELENKLASMLLEKRGLESSFDLAKKNADDLFAKLTDNINKLDTTKHALELKSQDLRKAEEEIVSLRSQLPVPPTSGQATPVDTAVTAQTPVKP